MVGDLPVAFGIYLKAPLLPINVERLTILNVGKFVDFIIEFVCVVDVLGVNLVSK